jgi:hypothetical protein
LLLLIIAATVYTSETLNETSIHPPTSGKDRHISTERAKIKDASAVQGIDVSAPVTFNVRLKN